MPTLFSNISGFLPSSCVMMNASAILVSVLLMVNVSPSESRSFTLPSPQCHPNIVSSMPDRYRKICEALATIFDLSDTVDNYIDEKGKIIFLFNEPSPVYDAFYVVINYNHGVAAR